LSRIALAAGVLALLAGCAKQVEFDRQFDQTSRAMAEAAIKPGPGEIRGQSFMRRPTGATVTNAGDWVFLVPATPYSDEVFWRLFGADRYRNWLTGNRGEVDPSMFILAHRVKANKGGTFIFEKVKLGRYYVTSKITWVRKENEIIPITFGGWIYDEVEVTNEDPVEVILSGN
jgi:hypothetical protein